MSLLLCLPVSSFTLLAKAEQQQNLHKYLPDTETGFLPPRRGRKTPSYYYDHHHASKALFNWNTMLTREKALYCILSVTMPDHRRSRHCDLAIHYVLCIRTGNSRDVSTRV